jgi:hypothetical protein
MKLILTRESPMAALTQTMTMAAETRCIFFLPVFHSSAKKEYVGWSDVGASHIYFMGAPDLLLQDRGTPMVKATVDMRTVPL